MKFNQLLVSVVAGLSALNLSLPAEAVEYKFNKHVGSFWVHYAQVYRNDVGGVTATAKVNVGTCPLGSDLRGYLNFSFVPYSGGYFENYKFYIYGYEGQRNVEVFVNVPYDMSDSGVLTLEDFTYCD